MKRIKKRGNGKRRGCIENREKRVAGQRGEQASKCSLEEVQPGARGAWGASAVWSKGSMGSKCSLDQGVQGEQLQFGAREQGEQVQSGATGAGGESAV